MQTIIAKDYFIFFENKTYENLNNFIEKSNYSSLFLLCDENSNALCVPKVLSEIATDLKIEIIEIEAGEALKNISTCQEVWSILTDYGADRKSLIINIGGGVITDLGGFVAATFKRGIDFINIPTTLLGMVDASIGGKNGVDLGNLKNQIGTITNPKMVLIDPTFLETLPKNQLLSGYAEILKHGLIFDKKYWDNCKNFDFDNLEIISKLIHRSIEIKNEIVNQDPTENGIRKALNFGHTLGHAIESYFLESENMLLHGEAIAIGMILETYLSKEKKLVSDLEYQEIKNIIKSKFKTIYFEDYQIAALLDLLIHDKKNEYGKVQFVLLESIGKVILNQNCDTATMYEAFRDYKLD